MATLGGCNVTEDVLSELKWEKWESGTKLGFEPLSDAEAEPDIDGSQTTSPSVLPSCHVFALVESVPLLGVRSSNPITASPQTPADCQ